MAWENDIFNLLGDIVDLQIEMKGQLNKLAHIIKKECEAARGIFVVDIKDICKDFEEVDKKIYFELMELRNRITAAKTLP